MILRWFGKKCGAGMPELELGTVARVISGQVFHGARNTVFKDFHFDSRAIADHSLFFAFKTSTGDGHRFVTQLAGRPGMGAVVLPDFDPNSVSFPIIRVADTFQAARLLAASVRDRFRSIHYVGIAGSAGKTTTKEFCFQILSRHFTVFRSRENWNNAIGVPFSILKLTGQEQVAVFELAMSDPGIGEIDLLAGLVKPDVAVVLNVFPVHLEYLKNLRNVARAKAELLNHLAADDRAIVNGDSPLLVREVRKKTGCKILFGRTPGVNQVVLKEIRRQRERTAFTVDFFGIEERFETTLVNHLQIENLVPAMLVAQELGMKNFQIQDALNGLTPIKGRGVIRRQRDCVIIDETYNSNPEALKKTLAWVDSEYHQPKIAVLGDMLELGKQERDFHYQAGLFFAGLGFAWLITVGQRAEEIARGARQGGFPGKRIRACGAVEGVGRLLQQLAQPGNVVLFKGSRGVALEKALEEFGDG